MVVGRNTGGEAPPPIVQGVCEFTLGSTHLPPQGIANPRRNYLVQPLHPVMAVRTLDKV